MNISLYALLQLIKNFAYAQEATTEKILFEDIFNLLNLLKNYHEDTFKHSINVCAISTLIAQKSGISNQVLFDICLGSLLHDIGKIKIPLRILDKPAKLDQEEWRIVKKHPAFGVRLLSAYSWSKSILPIVAYHHERPDGCGYFNLNLEKIPYNARIVCIADSFDAMYSDRPYQQPKSMQQCIKEIEAHSGSQFDMNIAQIFIKEINIKTAWLLKWGLL